MVPSYVTGGNYHHHLHHQYHQSHQQHPPHHHNQQQQGQRHHQNLQQNLHNSHSTVEIPREPLRKAFYIKVKDFATQYNISVPLVKQNNKECKEKQSKHVKEGECADEEHKTDTNDRLEEEKENETLLNQEHGSNIIISTSKEGINKDLTKRNTTGTTSIDGKDRSTSSYRSEQDQKEEGKDNDNDDDVILLNKSGSNSNQSFTNDQYANLGSGGFGGTSSVATSTLHHGGASTSMQQQHQYRQKNPSSGYNLCVLVGKVEIVVDKLRVDGSRVLLAEVQVGDETGCISLRARDQQIDILQNISKKAGAVILRNCTVELFKGKHLRLAVTKWGKLSVYPDNVPSTPMPPLSIDMDTNFSTVDLNDVILSRNSHSPLLLSHPSLITTTNIFQEPSTGEKPGRRPSSASVAGASSVMSHSSFDASFFPGMDTMPYSQQQQQQQHYHPNSQPPLGMMGGYQHSPLLMQPQYNPYYYQQQHPQYHGAHGFYHTPPTPLSNAISENKNTNLDNKSSDSSHHRPIANLAFLNQQQHSPSYNVSTDSTTTMATMPSVPYSNMHHSMPNVPPSLPHLQQHYDTNPNFTSYADPSFFMVNHHQYSFSPTGNFSGPGKRTLRKGKQHQNYSTHRQHAKQNQPKKFQSQNRFPQHQYPPTETRSSISSSNNTLAIPGIMRTISMDSHHTQSATSTLAINAPSFYPSNLNTPNVTMTMGVESNNGAASATSNAATTPLYPRSDQYTVYYPYGDGGPSSQVQHYLPSPDILHGSSHNNSMHHSHSGPPPPLSLGPPFYHHQNHLLVPPSGFGYGQQQAQLNVHPQNVTQTISEEALNEKICDSVEESETKSSAIGIPTIVHENELHSENSTGVGKKKTAVNSPSPSIQTEKSYVSYADKAAARIQKKTT